MIVRAQIAPGEDDQIGDEEKDGLADTYGVSATWDGDALFAALAYQRSYLEVDSPVPPPVTVAADLDLLRGTLGMALGDLELGAMVEQVRIDPDVSGADRADGTCLTGTTSVTPPIAARRSEMIRWTNAERERTTSFDDSSNPNSPVGS